MNTLRWIISCFDSGSDWNILLAPGLTLSADGEFADLTDDGVYVYGDESGSYYMIRTGIRLDF